MSYGYESGYGSGTPAEVQPSSSTGYGYESNYGADSTQTQAPQSTSGYSLSGLGQNALKDIGRNVLGYAEQIKQGAYDIPKAIVQTPVQLAQGTPYGQTEMGKQTAQFANQTPQTVQDVVGIAKDPIGAMYRNPVTTGLAATAVASKLAPLAQQAGIKGVSVALGPSQEAIQARLDNPTAIQNASSYADLAHQLPDTLNTLKDQISQHADNAYGTLRDSLDPTEGAIPKSQVQGLVSSLVDDLRTGGSLVGPARKGAVQNLNSVLEDINQIGGARIEPPTNLPIVTPDANAIASKGKPFALFIGNQEGLGPQYNVYGKHPTLSTGKLNHSTVGPQILEQEGIPITGREPRAVGDPAPMGEPNLSESHIKEILKSIDKNVNWQDKGASESNAALTNFRGQLDQILKQNNSNYATAMQPVGQKMGLLNDLKKAFSLTNQTGEGIQPTDSTISKLQSLPTERKSITQDLVAKLKQATGEDYIQKSKNYGFAKQFQGGSANGSRRVMGLGGAGAGVGAYLFGTPGAVAGEALGNVAGLVADKYGGNIAGGLTDLYAPVYQGISQAASSSPAQAGRQAAITALLNQYYAQHPSRKTSQ